MKKKEYLKDLVYDVVSSVLQGIGECEIKSVKTNNKLSVIK
mgnify:CR=1 FL=1